jgi:hypothetical protein
MGALADATGAPFVVVLGAGVCIVDALVTLALVGARSAQPSTAPLR